MGRKDLTASRCKRRSLRGVMFLMVIKHAHKKRQATPPRFTHCSTANHYSSGDSGLGEIKHSHSNMSLRIHCPALLMRPIYGGHSSEDFHSLEKFKPTGQKAFSKKINMKFCGVPDKFFSTMVSQDFFKSRAPC